MLLKHVRKKKTVSQPFHKESTTQPKSRKPKEEYLSKTLNVSHPAHPVDRGNLPPPFIPHTLGLTVFRVPGNAKSSLSTVVEPAS